MAVFEVIVKAQGQGFMAVNRPSPRAQPEDKVGLRRHKSMATWALTIICDRIWENPPYSYFRENRDRTIFK